MLIVFRSATTALKAINTLKEALVAFPLLKIKIGENKMNARKDVCRLCLKTGHWRA